MLTHMLRVNCSIRWIKYCRSMDELSACYRTCKRSSMNRALIRRQPIRPTCLVSHSNAPLLGLPMVVTSVAHPPIHLFRPMLFYPVHWCSIYPACFGAVIIRFDNEQRLCNQFNPMLVGGRCINLVVFFKRRLQWLLWLVFFPGFNPFHVTGLQEHVTVDFRSADWPSRNPSWLSLMEAFRLGDVCNADDCLVNMKTIRNRCYS